jgi:predicted component of type VI protein secretion system
VEFCTLIAILLKGHSVELVPEKEGEKWEGSRKLAIEGLDDRVTTLAMRMRRRVKVRLVERGREGKICLGTKERSQASRAHDS